MKVAVIGSRSIKSDIGKYIPAGVTEIITGGAEGVDRFAERYADAHGISKHIIRPDYDRHGKAAPLVRNKRIVNLADMVIAFWDGSSAGTAFTIKYARKMKKPLKIMKLSK
ncbi:MAG: DUF2493 domain-containing protein [Clostridia bacterium]|nr:DUF2493 domain-containing protein [Clostridia bacterium]